MPEVAEPAERTGFDEYIEKAAALGGPEWMTAIRESGAARFAETDFPTHRHETWRSTDIRPILKTEFRSAIGEALGQVDADALAPFILDESYPRIVFVDGQFNEALSSLEHAPEGVRLESLATATANDDALVREHLDTYAPSTNAFVALNKALVHDGTVLVIDANRAVETPVHAIYVSTANEAAASHPRNLVVIGESSECELIESYVGLGGSHPYLVNAVSELVVGANAHLTRTKLIRDDAHGSHLETAQVIQERDSRYTAYTITIAGQINRNELRVRLDGENAVASLNGLYLNDGDRVIDNALNVEHVAPHCKSRMAYKGILDDTSDAVFTGKVYVHQSAQQTDSDQLNQNLLLSDKATIDTRPQLEIFADDVKCTHGATIGGFPNEILFYFRSRGIEPVRAHGILTCGFADEIIDELNIESLQERLYAHVLERYKAR